MESRIPQELPSGIVQMKNFAVVGSPISHSLSPVLHRAGFAGLGIEATYEKYEVREGELREFLADHPLQGISVTMPLKNEAYVLCSAVDNAASRTRAVNTIVASTDGLVGANTDVLGFASVLDGHNIDSVPHAVIIGSGATARSAIVAVRERAARLTVMARNPSHALEGVDDVIPWGSALEADLIISTVPNEATGELSVGSGVLFDIIYSPWPTGLASRWPGKVLSGLELLIHQAAYQMALFAAPAPVDLEGMRATMRQALEAEFLSN